VDYVYYYVNVFVGGGLFLGEAFPTSALGDDAVLGYFAVDATALGVLDGGAVRLSLGRRRDSGAEGLLHGAGLAYSIQLARPMSPGMITGWPM